MGTINNLSKRATRNDIYNVELGRSSDDISGHIGSDEETDDRRIDYIIMFYGVLLSRLLILCKGIREL